MKVVKIKKYLTIFSNLKFAIFILAIIALISSFGSVIEQDESFLFYQENYPLKNSLYGFLNFQFILAFGLDHIYTTWWFLFLLLIFATSLISCTITRQFPLLSNSKEYFFRKRNTSFSLLPFFIKIKNIYYFKENIVLKIQKMNFYIYQKGNLIYGYKGLIGRISPILVHFSLIMILAGSSFGALKTFKAQEILPKGELFHIQNTIKIGWFTSIPNITIRVNDFWVEYKKNRIHQFYSNLSILDNYGTEVKQKTISVNNPLRYKNIDFYQSDWNILGIRVKEKNQKNTIYEFPLFQLKKNSKSWITWVTNKQQNRTIVLDQFQNTFLVYDQDGQFLEMGNLGDLITSNLFLLDILPATGLQMKYDPSISIIYFGFGLLMLTACLSYFPYTQIWIFNQKKVCWLGSLTNRGKIRLEIEFENLIRELENLLYKNIFVSQK